jgi:O-methyltransferase
MSSQDIVKLGLSRSACRPEQLKSLAELVYQLRNIPGDIVEIGSYKCGSTLILGAQSEDCSPAKKVFAFDTFSERPEASAFDSKTLPSFASNFEEAKNVTSVLPAIELVQGLHEDTIPKFAHRPVSLLFLDSDMYTSHVVALKHFWPDISPGGFLVFHDFVTLNCPGVRKAFDEFFEELINTPTCLHAFLAGMLAIQKV